jgi:hypothetical protein
MTKRAQRRRTADLPVATIAAYGPDDLRATKLVVSILHSSGDRDPRATRTWTTDSGDVRSDPHVAAEAAAFIAAHRVQRTVTADRIMGCPHQEGIDYPMGRTCPVCPFWAGIDRFTREPLAAPVASMPAEEVLQALAEAGPGNYEDALISADAHREALVGPLLEALEGGIADPRGASEQDASLFSHALYLLAKWREPRAYPYVIRWLSLPEEGPFDLAGDIVTQDGARILAGVCDGDLEPIKALILNRQAHEYGRSAGVSALALLAAWAEVPRAHIIDSLLWLAREGLEREPGAVWDALAFASADIEALEIFAELRRAYDDGLVNSQSIERSELDEVEAMPRGTMVRQTRQHHRPIDDVAVASAWWDRHQPDEDADDLLPPDRDDWDDEKDGDAETAEPYRAPAKVGRNEPCPCGSGKKYKKCCGR